MTVAKRFGQCLLSATVVGLLGFGCSSGLKDYTQVDIEMVPTEALAQQSTVSEVSDSDSREDDFEKDAKDSEGQDSNSLEKENVAAEEVDAAETDEVTPALLAVESAVEKRLLGLGLETAEVMVRSPNQVIVRLPEDVPSEPVVEKITKPNRLTLRSQKADTEEELATNIATLQTLLVEQNNLRQTEKLAEAEALQPKIDETRLAILDLFGPVELTGGMLTDAQAVQMSGFNTWEVQIWFDDAGSSKFAEQTKALAGTGRSIGLFLDDVLLSTPIVEVDYAEEGITAGASTISGNFTAEAAKELEQQLKTGALPSDLEVVRVTSSEQLEKD